MRFLSERLAAYLHFLKSMAKVNCHLLFGMWRLTRLPQPAITVFGGSRIPKNSIHSKHACKLAQKLACDGFSVITGGGRGIMEAANQGAYEYAQRCSFEKCKGADCEHKRKTRRFVTIGIGLLKFKAETVNPYIHDYIVMDYFFSRKWLLVRYAVGFVVFPGGFGTLDELFEIITLVQTEQMSKVPIILMGKRYWKPLIDMIHSILLPENLIGKDDVELIQVLDDVDEAFEFIRKQCKGCKR